MIGFLGMGVLALAVVLILTYQNRGELTVTWKGALLLFVLLMGGPFSLLIVIIWATILQKDFTVFHIEKDKSNEKNT